MKHFLTFDIEHWYESWRLRGLPFDAGLPDCDTGCIEKLLALLEETAQTATFFFTGNFAREFPEIARKCVASGHEIASHSMDHTLLTSYEGTDKFRANLLNSLEQIEKACGVRPSGFRAPKWTLLPENAADILSVLLDAGLKYDSSVFPGHFHALKHPCRFVLAGRDIAEIPATGLHFCKYTLPVGGAWFRLLPLRVSNSMFKQSAGEGFPAMFYAHPYDLNPYTHCPQGTPPGLRFMRRVGVHGAWKKLSYLLRHNRFTSIEKWLQCHENALKKIHLQ